MSGKVNHQLKPTLYVAQYLDHKDIWVQVGPEFTSQADARAKYEVLLKSYLNVRVVRREDTVWVATIV